MGESLESDIAGFDALVGYLRASGYFAIRPRLKDVPKVRILVGIDVDEITEKFHRKGQLFLADAGKALTEFKKGLEADIQQRNALELLKLLIQLPNLATKGEIDMLKYAQTSIKKGRYAELQRALNKTFNAQKKTPLKPAALLDHTIAIIDRYYDPAETADDSREDIHAGLSAAELAPVIILSESFTS